MSAVTLTDFEDDEDTDKPNANGHATQYTYDNIDRRIMEIYADPRPNTRTFVYDAVNMISRTDQLTARIKPRSRSFVSRTA